MGEVSTQEVETISIPTPLVTAPVSEARKRDPLIDIYGIGEAFEKRLFNAGIYTFEELANTSPQRLREIINPESWQKIEPESWIAEARLFAEKQRGAKS